MTVERPQQFQSDVDSIAAHYLNEAGLDVAFRFVAETEKLIDEIIRNPEVGSRRWGEVSLPGVRSKALPSFPYVVFYARVHDNLRFVRMLHGHRDLPPLLQKD